MDLGVLSTAYRNFVESIRLFGTITKAARFSIICDPYFLLLMD
jgi:hypothetical protein